MFSTSERVRQHHELQHKPRESALGVERIYRKTAGFLQVPQGTAARQGSPVSASACRRLHSGAETLPFGKDLTATCR